MGRVLLNVDLGERPGEPGELFALAHLVNVACGGHAGDDDSIKAAAERALRHGAWILAHPSYPDRAGFGRRSVSMTAPELRRVVEGQWRSLAEAARGSGAVLRGVKAHGALYHDANRDPALADAVLDATVDPAIVVGPATGAWRAAAERRGSRFLAEDFADRGHAEDGSLLARGTVGAVLDDPATCAAQAVRLARAGGCDTLCVHGDHPRAVDVLRAVRDALEREGLLGRP